MNTGFKTGIVAAILFVIFRQILSGTAKSIGSRYHYEVLWTKPETFWFVVGAIGAVASAVVAAAGFIVGIVAL